MAKGYKHVAGAEVRGEGPEALLCAVVLRAVADLDPPANDRYRQPHLSQEAREWLHSSGCAWALYHLEIPHHLFLEALNDQQLRQGTGNRAYWQRRDVA